MVDSFNSDLTWRPFRNEWLLFTENNKLIQNKPQPQKAKSKETPPQKSHNQNFFYSARKPESKGSLVYTPDGYGILQDASPSLLKFPVKIKNKINEYSLSELTIDIPLTLLCISSSIPYKETLTIPVFSTSADIIEKIESSLTKDDLNSSSKIFFQGKEMTKSLDSLEKIGILPNSKILVAFSLGKPLTISRFTAVDEGWGYGNNVDGIAFSVSKDIRIIGFGIYTPSREKEPLTGVGKLFLGSEAKDNPLFCKELSIFKDENDVENKVFRFVFDKPFKIAARESYSLTIQMKGSDSYYGSAGSSVVNGEKDVVFTFVNCSGSNNGTGTSSGQIPEIYYYA